MLLSRLGVWMFSVGVMVLGAGAASGQSYPSKSIRIVTAEAGTGSDFSARIIAQGLTTALGQQVVVDNRGGASGLIATEAVGKAPPDGHTLLVAGNSFWIGPLIQKVPYDPLRDFSPIAMLSESPNILVVHPSLPVKSVKELIAMAKVRPGQLNYGAAAIGTATHLAAELFKSMAGVNMVAVNYKGGAGAVNALISGEVELAFTVPAAAMPHIQSGRLRALAITSLKPTALVPGVTTVAATVPGYESGATAALFGPASMPAAIIARLNQEVVKILNQPDVKERFLKLGFETVGGSPEQLAATIKSDTVKWGKIIKDAGIHAD